MKDSDRLFFAFKPRHYDLKLTLDAKALRFKGSVVISGKRITSKPAIKLHAKDLQIESVTVNQTACSYAVDGDVLTIDTAAIKTSEVEVNINFAGQITKAMHGIYPAYPAGGSVMLGTQFESHHAREAFPCIDEPEAKASYDISLTSKEPVILSNMPARQTTNNPDGSKTVVFDTTPVMSSYLVAFVTGDLQSVSTTTENGTEITVWSSKDHDIESLIFPLEAATKTTEFLSKYFGVDYPLPKCDHVALPDFSSGAMENWGLITYREIALLADPNTISTSAKEYIATVIAHEIAHQWFGNLVTMKWWDDLWLNESFASLMEYLVVDAIQPDWNVMLNFAAHDALSAFRRDILPGVQPVSTSVHHPDEISTLFDPSIVYAKGARLLYMAYHLVGNHNFKKGLRQYFKTHAYGNTTGTDLWQALGDASNIDVAGIMKQWINQPGFPYLKITDNPNGSLALEQHQLTTTMHDSDAIWPVPLWQSGDEPLTIMTKRRQTIKSNTPHDRFNVIGGHYVPYYTSKQTRDAIFVDVRQHRIAPDGRLLLLHDQLLLSKCGVSSLVDALSALSAYTDEHEESVWSVISLVIGDTRMMTEGNQLAEQAIRDFTYELVKKQYLRLGFTSQVADSNNDKKLRDIITGLAVFSEQPTIIAAATNLFKSAPSVDALPADSRAAILTAAVKSGSDEIWQQLFNLYPNTTSADIQLDIAGALCSSKQAKHHKQLIKHLKDDQFVRLQDLDRFLIYMLRNLKSRTIAWQWLVKNWDWITASFAQDMSYDNYPRYAGSFFSTKEWLVKFEDHFGPLSHVTALTRNIDLGKKDIESKINWRQRDEQSVVDWLIHQ